MNTQQQIHLTDTQINQALERVCRLESGFEVYEQMPVDLQQLKERAKNLENAIANLLNDLGGNHD